MWQCRQSTMKRILIKESKDKETISKDENEEINEIMNLLKDHSFYLKCEEYDLQFENELILSTSQWMNY